MSTNQSLEYLLLIPSGLLYQRLFVFIGLLVGVLFSMTITSQWNPFKIVGTFSIPYVGVFVILILNPDPRLIPPFYIMSGICFGLLFNIIMWIASYFTTVNPEFNGRNTVVLYLAITITIICITQLFSTGETFLLTLFMISLIGVTTFATFTSRNSKLLELQKRLSLRDYLKKKR